MIEVEKWLKHAVGDKGMVARWGGDEFTVIRTNIENKGDLTSLIERIKNEVSEPITIRGNTLFVTTSIGVSFSIEDGDTAEALIKNADATMYRAKIYAKNHSRC